MIRIDCNKPTLPAHSHLVYAGKDAHRTLLIHQAMWEEWERGGFTRESPPAIYTFLMACVPVYLLAGIRGLDRDDAAARKVFDESMNAITPLRIQAEKFVQTSLASGAGQTGAWPRFNIASDDQLIVALYGERKPARCPACDWTGHVYTEFAQTRFKPSAWLSKCIEEGRSPTERPNAALWVARREIVEKSRKCDEHHTYPGFHTAQYRRDGHASVAREDLGKLVVREVGRPVAELAQLRLTYSELSKIPQELLGRTAPSGRFPYTLSIGTTDTHRLSSYKNPYDEGRNGQNLDHRTRRAGVYRAGPGYSTISVDQSKAESHFLAAVAQDAGYLQAHEGDVDTHAMVANWIWPELDWPEDGTAWKKFASSTAFTRVMGLPYSIPDDNLRAISKKVQHALPRGQGVDGTAQTIRCDRKTAERVQETFAGNIPATMRFLKRMRERVAAKEIIHLGVALPPSDLPLPASLEGPAVVLHVGHGIYWWRQSFTDPRNAGTTRDLVAFILQSPVALATHISAIRWWRAVDNRRVTTPGGWQYLLNTHDASVVSVPNSDAQRASELLCQYMTVEYELYGRPLRIPVEATIGESL